MLRFETIEYLFLLLLIPVMVFFYFWFDKNRQKKLLVFGNSEIVDRLTASVSKKQRWIKRSLTLFAIFFLCIAFSNPQLGSKLEEVKREGIDILVAIDVSNSMLAEDIAPNRLKKAKFEVREFIKKLNGDRIGLIPFAGIAYIQCPLTLDYSSADLFLDMMDENSIPEQGTSLSSAIKTAMNSFPGKERKYKVLVIITDGEDHEEGIEEIAKSAKEEGVVIYTIGIGSLEGVPIPQYDNSGNKIGFKKDNNDEIVLTKLNDEVLKEIATITGGKFFHVTPSNPELEKIVSDITKMEKKELGSKEYTSYEDRFQIFLLFSILILFIEFFISERAKKASEWKGRFN